MKYLFLTLCGLLLATAANAGQPEAREVARMNNCTPKKIEVFQQALGGQGKTIYRVECTLPKTVGNADKNNQPTALLINCDQNLCDLMRPVLAEKK